jgi:hypothetical protein
MSCGCGCGGGMAMSSSYYTGTSTWYTGYSYAPVYTPVVGGYSVFTGATGLPCCCCYVPRCCGK